MPSLDEALKPFTPEGNIPKGFETVPEHLRDVAPDNSVSEGSDRKPGLDQPQLRACLDHIPNSDIWDEWNAMGMRIYASTNGEAYGLDEFKHWSRKWAKAGANEDDECDKRWNAYHGTPPTRTGAGALIVAVREQLNNPQWMPPISGSNPPPGLPSQVTVTSIINSHDIHLPPEYTLNPQGWPSVTMVREDNSTYLKPVMEYTILEAWQQSDPIWMHFFITRIPREGDKTVGIEFGNIGGMGMRKDFGGQGILIPRGGKKLELFTEFQLSWAQELQRSKATVNPASYGWNSKFDHTGKRSMGFVYAGTRYLPGNTEERVGVPDPTTFKIYQPKGAIGPWHKISQLITNQQRPDLDIIFAASFAAPLVSLTGHNGALLAVYGESASGKTTALTAGLTVWGHAVKGKLSVGDTEKSMMKRISDIHSLPVYWDEMGQSEDIRKRLMQCVFQFTEGRDRSRLTRNIELRELKDWQTLVVTLSNKPFLDHIFASGRDVDDAALYRIFQTKVAMPMVGSPGRISPAEAQIISHGVREENYGHAGVVYAKWLAENHANVAKEVEDFCKGIESSYQAIPQERFWIMTIATLLLGAKYANQCGLTNFDLKAMEKYLRSQLLEMRNVLATRAGNLKQALNVQSIMQQFRSEFAPHTLKTDKMTVGPGRVGNNAFKIVNDGMNANMRGIYLHESESGTLRIARDIFNNWVREEGYPVTEVIDALRNGFGMKPTFGNLGSGTPYGQGRQHLWEIMTVLFD